MFPFCVLFYFKKNVKRLLKNFEYSKSQKTKKLSVLRPDLSFLEKCVTSNVVGICTDVPTFIVRQLIPRFC